MNVSIPVIQGTYDHTQIVLKLYSLKSTPVDSELNQLVKNGKAEVAKAEPLPEQTKTLHSLIRLRDGNISVS
jgi:hypothetical protein